ncbi:MAG: hypothetical protein HY423_06915 [Candidatus Lambdaproteobacteria bacterium]|nr:hypothetical protein [Candidatus Lambdaproteobacteria bacterium]
MTARANPKTRITDEQILAMQRWRPRRVQLATEWADPLQGGDRPGAPLRLVLPFRESLEPAFRLMGGPRQAGFRQSHFRENGKGLWVLALKGGQTAAHRLAEARHWLETVGRYVAIRDCLDLCFALDYDRALGHPEAFRTETGRLRFRAKPLTDVATPAVLEAAEGLVARGLRFLEEMRCYDGADVVAAAPPSKRGRPYHLPAFLARRIAGTRGLLDLSDAIRTVRDRPATKNRPLAAKLRNIRGSVEVDPDAFRQRKVLLVDDIYQSGTTLNYVAGLLYRAGASAVYGLICEKTSRDDDNLRAKPAR